MFIIYFPQRNRSPIPAIVGGIISLLVLIVIYFFFMGLLNGGSSNEKAKITSINGEIAQIEWTDKYDNNHTDDFNLSVLKKDQYKARVKDKVNLNVDYLGMIEKTTIALSVEKTYDKNIREVKVTGLSVFFVKKWFR